MDTLTHSSQIAGAVKVLHILSPVGVMLAYVVASLASIFRTDRTKAGGKSEDEARKLRIPSLALTVLVMASYIAESIILIYGLPSHAATSSDHYLAYSLFSWLVWLILSLGLVESAATTAAVTSVFSPAWALALGFDICFLVLGATRPVLQGPARICQLCCQASRLALLLVLVGMIWGRCLSLHGGMAKDEEVEPLLAQVRGQLGAQPTNGHAYGTSTVGNAGKKSDANGCPNHQAVKKDDETDETDDQDEDDAEKGKLQKDWWVYTKAFAIFLPHMWPRKNVRLQLHFPGLALCLLTCRALNVVVPLQLGLVVNSLRDSAGTVPWMEISVFIILRLLDSSAGVNLLQSWLWMPIQRYTTEQLSTAAYNQVMDLSSDFHDSKRSGRTWRIVGRGESLSDLVQTVVFEMLPMAADLVLVISVLWWLFDAYMAFLVSLSSVLFLWATAQTIPMKTERQRDLINAWEDEYSQMTESSLNWTTVSYFNQIGYEQDRFRDAVSRSQSQLIRYRVFSFIVSAVRTITLQTGLMFAALLAAYQISKGNRSVGDFVVLITYWAQLMAPLASFANGFSKIAKSLVDAEKLLELLQTKPTVQNEENATRFILKQGQVDFDRVCFSYDGQRQVANNASFRAEPGQTVALVGETGGGKSTVLKLLFRFYDVTSGSVVIDGQDVRHVTLESLRAHIGCVPQDPVLFNQTIMENMRYARLDATEEEVQEACKAVALHDKILSFTKGYSEKVGERGVKLSGGELQRMAIARAILKDPKILLLDEATSSVDSETEAVIQSSLKKLCAGRTTFVIAHRLSTIIHADQIMVIKDGQIIERGPHDKLMTLGGQYCKLWTRQLRLQTVEDGSPLGSRSREKPTAEAGVSADDATNRSSLSDSESHKSKSSGEDQPSTGQSDDGGRDVDSSSECGDRGRPHERESPRQDNRGLLGSLKHSTVCSKLAPGNGRKRDQETKSASLSPRRTSLKPDAPDFVPQTCPGTLRCQACSAHHGQAGSRLGRSGGGCWWCSAPAEAQKENLSASAPSRPDSVSALCLASTGKAACSGSHASTCLQRCRTSGRASQPSNTNPSESVP